MSSPVTTTSITTQTKNKKSFSLRDAIINNSPRKKSQHKQQHNSNPTSNEKEKQKSQKLAFIHRSYKGLLVDGKERLSGGSYTELSEDFKSSEELETPHNENHNHHQNNNNIIQNNHNHNILQNNDDSGRNTKNEFYEDTTVDDTDGDTDVEGGDGGVILGGSVGVVARPDIPLLNLEDSPENNQAVAIFQKYILKWNCEIELMKREQWQLERTFIVQEILSSEETYVKVLNMVITDVYDPVLYSHKTDDPILEPNMVKNIFPEGHIKIIHTAHAGFILELRERIEEWGPQQVIGDIFNEMCKFLRLYTKYAETLVEVEETLEFVKKEKKFLHFLKEKWPDKGDPLLYLRSLLITPVQRIPRYQLLLESLYKKTWPSHRDYEALGSALLEMKNTAQYVNDKAKEGDRSKKLIQIETSLIGLKKPLASASRKFIKEGLLYNRTEKGEWKKRYFFLFNDCMVRARINRKQKGSYIFIEKVTLRQGQVWEGLQPDIEDEIPKSERELYFEFTQPHPLRYVLCAATVEEKRDWCNAIQGALDEMEQADREHQEIKKKISVQKAKIAKHLITYTIMQRQQQIEGAKEARIGARNSGGKSLTADLSNIRSYKEHLVTKMTAQEKWAQTKQSETDVQNWEKAQKQSADKKKLDEALIKEEKRKEIVEQLNNRQPKRYHQLLQEVKQNSGRTTTRPTDDN